MADFFERIDSLSRQVGHNDLALTDERVTVPLHSAVVHDAESPAIAVELAIVDPARLGAEDSDGIAALRSSTFAALPDVLGVRFQSQVCRIAAQSVRARRAARAREVCLMAKMVDSQSVFDFTEGQLPRETMGQHRSCKASELSVSIAAWLTKPRPAVFVSSAVNVGPEKGDTVSSHKLSL